MRETHALRLTGAAAGEEQRRLGFAAVLRQAEAGGGPGSRQSTDERDPPRETSPRIRGQEIGDVEDAVAPREVRKLLSQLIAEGAGGHDELDLRALQAGQGLLASEGEIQVHRHLVGEQTAEVGDRRRDARRQHDRDALGRSPFLQLTREGPGQGEQSGAAEFTTR